MLSHDDVPPTCLFFVLAVGGGQEDSSEDAGADRQAADQSQELQETSGERRESKLITVASL